MRTWLGTFHSAIYGAYRLEQPLFVTFSAPRAASQGVDEFGKGVCVHGQAARQPPLSPMNLQAPEHRAVRGRCDSARWQKQLHLHALVITPRTDSEAVAEAEEFGRMEKLYRSKPGAPSTKKYAWSVAWKYSGLKPAAG